MKQRNSSDDFCRAVAMLFVIGIHTNMAGFTTGAVNACKILFLSCNGLFFLLSGKYGLGMNLATAGQYKSYYRKKLLTVGIPFLVASVVFCVYYHHGVGAKSMLKFLGQGLFQGASPHLWFMYPLIGMLISAPFLAKLIRVSSDEELTIMVGIGLVWEGVRAILCRDLFWADFEYIGWFLDSWPLYFFLGGCYERIVKRKKVYILVGLLMGVISFLQLSYFPERAYNVTDRSPVFILFVLGLYLGLSFVGERVTKGRGKQVVAFLAKYSFGVYLFHWLFIEELNRRYSFCFGTLGDYAIRFVICLVLSLLTAILYQNTIGALAKRLAQH